MTRKFFDLDLLDNRYPALHGMRVLAIVSVVQVHVTSILAFEEKLPFSREWVTQSITIFFGMDLFFVLSGFLIGSILIRSLQSPGKNKIRRFYLRRAFRTFPSYYVVLTVLALVLGLTAAQSKHLPFEYAYLTNFFKPTRDQLVMLWGWSLALEEQFYLAVPLLFFLLLRIKGDRARIAFLVALWLLALAIRLTIYLRWRPWSDPDLYGALYFRTHTRFDTLVCGILLAVVQDRYGAAIGRWLGAPFPRALVAMASLTCLMVLVRPWMFGDEHTQLVRVFAWGTLTSIMYFGWGLLLLHGTGLIQRALSAHFFRRVATLGYGVYLVHIPLFDHVIAPMARRLHAHEVSLPIIWIASLAALLAVSLAVAYAMHLLIEKPSLWVRDKVAG